MTELKPAADEEPVSAYLAAMRWQAAASSRHFRELHARYCVGETCQFCHPVTPPRPLRVRVDTGPVGYLWLEWLGACARVAGIAS
jgi:hypothetical protein